MSAVLNGLNEVDQLHELNAAFSAMPPVYAMAIKAVKLDAGVLSVSAPLDKNVNDKACAFGGSLVSVMTMAA
ncbi:MAG: YiiD C-terminal domain-containing protein, partial [Arenimonas sp.]